MNQGTRLVRAHHPRWQTRLSDGSKQARLSGRPARNCEVGSGGPMAAPGCRLQAAAGPPRRVAKNARRGGLTRRGSVRIRWAADRLTGRGALPQPYSGRAQAGATRHPNNTHARGSSKPAEPAHPSIPSLRCMGPTSCLHHTDTICSLKGLEGGKQESKLWRASSPPGGYGRGLSAGDPTLSQAQLAR